MRAGKSHDFFVIEAHTIKHIPQSLSSAHGVSLVGCRKSSARRNGRHIIVLASRTPPGPQVQAFTLASSERLVLSGGRVGYGYTPVFQGRTLRIHVLSYWVSILGISNLPQFLRTRSVVSQEINQPISRSLQYRYAWHFSIQE